MVVIPGPVEFLMGEDILTSHKEHIGYSYALAAKEVTVEQFLRFARDHDYDKKYGRTPDSPINGVTWYEATAYCNWLSEQEGLTPCYVRNADGRFGPGMKIAPNFSQLTGYRLPTEAEWEYACRADAVTSRFYGETEKLLDRYAWYALNALDTRMLPVGSLKPNDFGFFDLLGNAAEWCQDAFVSYAVGSGPKPGGGVGADLEIQDNRVRVIRGGSCNYLPKNVSSGRRNWYLPANRNFHVGFRPAKVVFTK
jgi:formylglycine-generating enzyme required for sulfatase activity